MILDNYCTHKHGRKVRAWLERHPALDLPLHPDVKLVAERGGGVLRQADAAPLKHGVFHSVVDLQAAINRFHRRTQRYRSEAIHLARRPR